MSNMIYEKLANFLTKYPKTGHGKHTHTIYGGGDNAGSYTIPSDKTDEFYKLVSKSLFRNKDKISIVEKLQPICRMVIDFDFKYKERLETRQYNSNVVKKFLNDKGEVVDYKGYHKAMYAARNADTIAQHFYEQGKADAVKDVVAKSKNINTEPRTSAPADSVYLNGLKVKI